MALQLSTLSAKEAITAIYVGYYDRAPDPAGLNYWIGRYNEFRDGAGDGDAGLSLSQIAASFSVQPETTNEYPFFTSPNVASATVFITQVYLNLFNRAPDQAGLDYWVDQLTNNPDSIGQIIINIISGAQDNGPGLNDRQTVLNKIEVACDWAESAADAGIDTVPFTATSEPGAQDARDTEIGGSLTVTPLPDGPVKIEGNVEVVAASGRQIAVGEKMFLCRCGQSGTKPFCDGSHAKAGFTAP